MALNWNIENCKDYKELTKGSPWITTDLLIWATMFIGIPTITEANHREFYARLHLIELMSGTFSTIEGKPHYTSLEDVKRRIGLKTNATNLTRAQFIKLKVGNYFSEVIHG